MGDARRCRTSHTTPAGRADPSARAHLRDVLDLAGDAHDLSMSLDDNLRRLCNQAFVDQMWITDQDTIEARPHQGFAVVLHPGVQQAALAADKPGDFCDLHAFDQATDVRGVNVTGWVFGRCAPCHTQSLAAREQARGGSLSRVGDGRFELPASSV